MQHPDIHKELTDYLQTLLKEASPLMHQNRGYFRYDADVLYLRYGPTVHGMAVTLATITVAEKDHGKGRCTAYLDAIEAFAEAEGLSIKVESVTSSILVQCLLKRNFLMQVGSGFEDLCADYYRLPKRTAASNDHTN